MNLRAATAAALLLVLPASAACTPSQDVEETSEPAGEAAPSESPGTEAEQPRAAGGPLRTDGGGAGCSWNPSRVFVYGDDILTTSEPVEIEAVQLVDGLGVHIVSAWVMPAPEIAFSGSWVEWPLPRDAVRGKARLHWEERERAVGARLDPGESYNFVVRMRRERGSSPQGFGAVRLDYRTDDGSYSLDTDTALRFRATRKGCR